jgi:YesN/AraC family two-component response regulator
MAAESKDVIENEFGICFSISISGIHKGFGGIAKAYQEAVEALEYKLLKGSGQIILSNETILSNDVDFQDSHTNRQEQKFINCIKAGDYMAAASMLDEIFSSLSANTVSVQMAKCKMFGLINSILIGIEGGSVVQDKEFFKELNPVERLLNCKNIIELHTQMDSVLKSIDNYSRKKNSDNDATLKASIVSFIAESYADPDFSAAKIAGEFKISPAQLSRFFKKNMDIGILEYVHKIRIENSKPLLTDSDMKIKDIAEKVGYIHSLTFIRIFKKYMGITPGQYRGE